MMYRKFLGIFALIPTISILAGCAPKPQIEVYMEPVAGREHAQIDAETGSISVERRDVEITLEPLDEVDLFELTEDPGINPYLGIDRWGNVEPLYTVFGIHIENRSNSRVVIDSTAILVDLNGEQYASLPYDYFKELYENVRPKTVAFYDPGYRYRYPYPRSYHRSPYRYYHHPYNYRLGYRYGRRYPYTSYRVYDYYPDPAAANHERLVARETVFDGGQLFSGAQREGFLVFDRLDIGATDVKVILPEVQIVNKKKKKRSESDFVFDFRQVVNVKE